MSTAPVETSLVPHEAPGELSVEQILAQAQKIALLVEKVLIEGEHYGVIPGTGGNSAMVGKDGKPRPPKKTLLKPGAEKLCLLFRLDPQYEIIAAVENPALIRFSMRCTLFHIPTGARIASGLGSCNSNEDKYLRPADKRCPLCEKTAIKKSKFPPKNSPNEEPGWYCYAKIGGCGANFNANDKSITEQDNGIKDPADLHNTILKMACKRALIAAVLNATAASDFFTQDLEDLNEKAAEYIPPDNLKEKLEESVEAKKKERSAPKADGTTASAAENERSEDNPATASPASVDGGHGQTTTDTGEAATDAQKNAIRLHIRKKEWKRGFVRVWFAELFDIPPSTPDPVEFLTQMQADAAHFLILAHGTANYRKIRHEYAEQGMCRRDENDVTF